MLENGFSSVIHSSINIPNEYVSDCFVGRASKFSMSSSAPYLIKSPDEMVDVADFLEISSTITVIPKSHICAVPSYAMTTFLQLTLPCTISREWR